MNIKKEIAGKEKSFEEKKKKEKVVEMIETEDITRVTTEEKDELEKEHKVTIEEVIEENETDIEMVELENATRGTKRKTFVQLAARRKVEKMEQKRKKKNNIEKGKVIGIANSLIKEIAEKAVEKVERRKSMRESNIASMWKKLGEKAAVKMKQEVEKDPGNEMEEEQVTEKKTRGTKRKQAKEKGQPQKRKKVFTLTITEIWKKMAERAREDEMEIDSPEKMEMDGGESHCVDALREKRKREKEITKKTTKRYENVSSIYKIPQHTFQKEGTEVASKPLGLILCIECGGDTVEGRGLCSAMRNKLWPSFQNINTENKCSAAKLQINPIKKNYKYFEHYGLKRLKKSPNKSLPSITAENIGLKCTLAFSAFTKGLVISGPSLKTEKK